MAEYPEVLLDVAACLSEALERKGIPAEKSSDLAFEAVESLRKRWGGMDVYIPMAEFLDLAPKHLQVYAQWKGGGNMLDLVREFGYSVQWIRQIVRASRTARAQKVTSPPLLDMD